MPKKFPIIATKSASIYPGPVGTFTEPALAYVKESNNPKKTPVSYVAQAIELVIPDRAV